MEINTTIYEKRCSHGKGHVRTGKMQHFAFTGCFDLCIKMFCDHASHKLLVMSEIFYIILDLCMSELCVLRAVYSFIWNMMSRDLVQVYPHMRKK
jgi:hypothetical protein